MDQSLVVARGWSIAEAQVWAEDVRAGFGALRARLLEGYEARAWELLGYESWRECVVAEFGQSEAYLYRQLAAAEVEGRISPMGENAPIPERQLRPLSKLTPLEQKDAWEEAVATAPNGKMTAAHVEAVVAQRLHPETPAPTIDELDDEANEAAAALDEAPDDVPEPGTMAVHFSSASPEWYTPKDIIDRVIAVFGAIDLDPCSNTGAPNVPAKLHYTEADDGLSHDWEGRVYMNPPYGRGIDPWIAHLLEQYKQGICVEAIALVPARVDTDWFQRFDNWPWCAVDGRLKFSGHQNAAPFPSAIFYVGNAHADEFDRVFGELGPIYQRRA